MYDSFRKVQIKGYVEDYIAPLLLLFFFFFFFFCLFVVFLIQYNVWLGIRRVCTIILGIYFFADVHLS